MTNVNKTTTDNPFYCGGGVTGYGFTGRERELGEIHVAIRAGKSVIMHSERKMGKTSILLELARRHSKDFVFAHVDLTGTVDEDHFVGRLVRECLKASFPEVRNLVPAIWDLASSPKLRLMALERAEPGFPDKCDSRTIALTLREIPQRAPGKPGHSLEIKMCPTCGAALKWFDKYRRHYCYVCKKYASKARTTRLRPLPVRREEPHRTCPECRGELSYVESYGEYYCPVCRKYPFLDLRTRSMPKLSEAEIAEALDLPDRIGHYVKKRVVVMFDEFHEILSFDSAKLLKEMASRLGAHRNACYIFSASNWHQLRRVFEEKDGELSRFAHPIDLRALPPEELEDFLISRFRLAGGSLSRQTAVRIVSVSHGHPYYAQHIAHELMHISKTPTLDDVEGAIAASLDRHSLAYSTIWRSARTPLQKRYLLAVAAEPNVPHGKSFIMRHGLRSRAHVQKVEERLRSKGIISGGTLTDPMFELWLRRLAVR